jgi:hypothetical protein
VETRGQEGAGQRQTAESAKTGKEEAEHTAEMTVSSAVVSGSEMRLTVKYSGLEVDRGRMGALDLGPAIFGVGEMFSEASRLLYKDDARIRVEVDADLQHASFGIEFIAVAIGYGLVPPLTLDQLNDIAGILGFGLATVTATITSVVGLYRWQRGRKIDSAERKGDHYEIKIGGDVQLAPTTVYNVFVRQPVRDGFAALTKPLEREGVDSVSVKAGNAPPEIITKEEESFFASAPLPEEEISVDQGTAILEIISPAFRAGLKWRFAQGNETFFADIQDPNFLAQVALHSQLFGQGDALRVQLETTTRRTSKGFAYERVILKVLAHIPAEKGGDQLPLI